MPMFSTFDNSSNSYTMAFVLATNYITPTVREYLNISRLTCRRIPEMQVGVRSLRSFLVLNRILQHTKIIIYKIYLRFN